MSHLWHFRLYLDLNRNKNICRTSNISLVPSYSLQFHCQRQSFRTVNVSAGAGGVNQRAARDSRPLFAIGFCLLIAYAVVFTGWTLFPIFFLTYMFDKCHQRHGTWYNRNVISPSWPFVLKWSSLVTSLLKFKGTIGHKTTKI